MIRKFETIFDQNSLQPDRELVRTKKWTYQQKWQSCVPEFPQPSTSVNFHAMIEAIYVQLTMLKLKLILMLLIITLARFSWKMSSMYHCRSGMYRRDFELKHVLSIRKKSCRICLNRSHTEFLSYNDVSLSP